MARRALIGALGLVLSACGGDAPVVDLGNVGGSVPAGGSSSGQSAGGTASSGSGGTTHTGGAGGSVDVFGTVTGRVFASTTLEPLAGATLRGGGLTATTDADGDFSLQVPAGTRVVLQIDHADFARGIEPLVVQEGGTRYLEVRLAAITARATFDAASGGGVTSSSGAAAEFPAGSLRTAAGAAVTGDVEVTLAALDPSDAAQLQAFPGDFTATTSAGTQGILETYVPMDISVRQGDIELQLAAGASAEVSFPIFDGIAAPSTIGLWSLDPTTGSWVEEGTAVRTTDAEGNPIYRASIGHMSWWNCDAFIEERTCIRGCVSYQGNPVPNAYVRARGIDFRNEGGGTTDASGCFVEDTKAGARLQIVAGTGDRVSDPLFVTADTTLRTAAEDPAACQDVGTLELEDRDAAAAQCPAGLSRCDTWCVDLTSDPGHCGACGVSCSDGTDGGTAELSCVEGECQCRPGELACAGFCTDPDSDRDNCGKCGNACATGTECVGGTCQPIECGSLTLCGNSCVDTNANASHCGACDTPCGGESDGPGGLSCVAGECACAGGQTKCTEGDWEYCANLQDDFSNCGACGTGCDVGEQCVAGKCEAITCEAQETLCGFECADLQTNMNHCGACNDVCYDIGTDDGGEEGSSVATCAGGTCGCVAGYTDCRPDEPLVTECRDLATDRDNCGTCGNSCVTGQTCVSGSCVAIECAGGLTLCGNECVDLATDSSHCGACGEVCPAGECSGGSCACPAGEVACLPPMEGEGVNVTCAASSGECTAEPAQSCGDIGGDWSVDLCGTERLVEITQVGCAFSGGYEAAGFFTAANDVTLYVTTQGLICSATLSGDTLTGQCTDGSSSCALSASRPACTAPARLCGSTCRDLTSEQLNCGFCGNYCGQYGACVESACVSLDQAPACGCDVDGTCILECECDPDCVEP